MNINWKIRFTKNNILFWVRFISGLLIPILSYMGLKYEDLTTWPMLWDAIVKFVSNPYLLFLTFWSAVIIIPDPTTSGLSDSEQALKYKEPKRT